MIRILRYTFLPVQFLVSTLLGLIICVCRPFHPTNSRWAAQIYVRTGLPILGMKVDIRHADNFPKDRAFVIIANHQSNWDLYVIAAALPERAVSIGKTSLKWIPLFGQLYWLAGNVLLDRSNQKKAMEAMETTKRALTEKNTRIWFFPEGTRNHGKNMKSFKKGAFMTAINAGVPIVPICCSPYLKDFDLSKRDNGIAKIEVLPPIETQGLSKDDLDDLMKRCHDNMMAKLSDLEKTA